MNIRFILTTFSPAMFGRAATAHIKVIEESEAKELVTERSRILATRAAHERLARNLFPNASDNLVRYVEMKPGESAIVLQYKGPALSLDGHVPEGGTVVYYLIETEEYQHPT
jgi:predicted ATP-binding protein involved in virulence